MSDAILSIARDFAPHPGPRYVAQGRFSGEAFRARLRDALAKVEFVTVDLDGTSGFGSSFLDEAFGGLIRHDGFTAADLKRRLRIISTLDESYLDEVRNALDLAKPQRQTA